MPADAEARISACVGRLRSVGADQHFSQTPLGEFWDPEMPRSPFEEALTIQQVCTIKLEPVIRKRSFSEAKLEALIVAMGRCADAVAGSAQGAEPAKKAEGSLSSAPSMARTALSNELPPSLQATWHPVLEPWRSHLRAIVLSTQSQSCDGNQLLRILCQGSTPVQLETLLALALGDVGVAAGVLKKTPGALAQLARGAVDEFKRRITSEPRLLIVESWTRSVAGLAPSRAPWTIQSDRTLSSVEQSVLNQVILRALGLVELKLPDYTGEPAWAYDTRTVLVILLGVRASLPAEGTEVHELLRRVFPLMTEEQQASLLSLVARHQPGSPLWVARRVRDVAVESKDI